MNKPKKGAVIAPNIRTEKDLAKGINVHLTVWCISMVHRTGDERYLNLGRPWQGKHNEPRLRTKGIVEPVPDLFT